MKKYSLLAATAVIGVGVGYQGSVNLQATTPGTAQVGHLNINGTARAGQFIANSTVPTGQVIAGDFRTASPDGRAILGNASATTGPNFGGLFQSFSSQGRAVGGIAVATTGTNFGGFFTSNSVIGNGIFGQATSATGVNFGVKGKAVSPDGFGVFSEGNMSATGIISGNGSGLTSVNAELVDGLDSTAFLQSVPNPLNLGGPNGASPTIEAQNNSGVDNASGVKGMALNGGDFLTFGGIFQSFATRGTGVIGTALASSGSTFGGIFQCNSTSGTGVFGSANAATGATIAGRFDNGSVSGTGVRGSANAATGFTTGGRFLSLSEAGTGLFGIATATTGNTFGGQFQCNSTSGTGVFGIATAPNGITEGGSFESQSATGTGVSGLGFIAGRFTSSASSGFGIIASSANIGGDFLSSNLEGFGGLFNNSALGNEFDVELSGPNGAINTPGFVYREYTATTRSAAIPIAYGSIDAAGVILGGTGNFTLSAHTITGAYDITIVGETYSNAAFSVTVTPVTNSPMLATVADTGASFRANIWSLAGALTNNAFQFTVWRADPTPPGDGGRSRLAPEDNGGTGRTTFKRPDRDDSKNRKANPPPGKPR